MTTDDIIRRFLDLHPDTPMNGQEYAIQLRMVSLMLKVAIKLEREACASLCFQMWDKWMDSRVGNERHDNANIPDAEDCAAAIRERSNHG